MIGTLPPARAQLPAWPSDSLRKWADLEERARVLTSRAGTGRAFDDLVVRVRAMLDSDRPDLPARATERRFGRAVVTAWTEDAGLARRTMTPELLAALHPTGQERPSRLTVVTTTSLLLAHVERLDEWRPGLFAHLADTIRAMVAASVPGRADLVETLRTQGAFLLDLQGARTLARHLLSTGSSLRSWLRAHHLAQAENLRFGHLVRDAVYLVQIEDADPGVPGHEVLSVVQDEVLARQRSTASDDGGRAFGHDVLTALISRDVRRPAVDWLDTITSLAGDPRHRQTAQWAQWWGRLEPRLVERAVRWMSTADLRTFLGAVEDYGRAQGKTDLTRMLAPRRRFLDGLYETDRIRETRLVLGPDVRRRVAGPAGLSDFDVALYADVNGNDKAVIIVDCGDFTIVEGSHNFRLFLFAGRPVDLLMNRAMQRYSLDMFRRRVPSEHERIHGPGRWVAISHQAGWQREAFSFLRRIGVQVDERALVDGRTFAAVQDRRSQEVRH